MDNIPVLLSHAINFAFVAQWMILHGYAIMFVAMLVEGPIVTAAAAFMYTQGYFSLAAIFALSLLGDIVADIIYYIIGYWGRITVVERYGHWVGLSQSRLQRMEHLMHQHAGKTLLALKLTPFLPTPGLMLVGATRMPLMQFISTCLLIIIPKSLLFMIVGYYFGKGYSTFSTYFGYGGTAIALAVLAIIVYQSYRRASARIGSAIEDL
jgi:membrane protein DedA with SNARE-associated domain